MKTKKTKCEHQRSQRVGTVIDNISGFKMKCIEYRNSMDIDVEFLDTGYIVRNVQWNNFIRGKVKDKNIEKNYCSEKEYYTWHQMLRRCFNAQLKEDKPTYKDATCCEEWMSYKNFYNWMHSQENYKQWKDLKWSAIDKDILKKGNKIYSPENCLLVPVNVNNLFVKHDALRGEHPIGVCLINNKYAANCTNPFNNKVVRIGLYETAEEAFAAYKEYKEDVIRKVADIEYGKGTITLKCKDAMYAYKIEITD